MHIRTHKSHAYTPATTRTEGLCPDGRKKEIPTFVDFGLPAGGVWCRITTDRFGVLGRPQPHLEAPPCSSPAPEFARGTWRAAEWAVWQRAWWRISVGDVGPLVAHVGRLALCHASHQKYQYTNGWYNKRAGLSPGRRPGRTELVNLRQLSPQNPF